MNKTRETRKEFSPMQDERFRGKAFVLGDNIDTDQILPGYAMSAPKEQLRHYVLKGSSIPDFSERVQQGDIIIGGDNFGCGSSREQAPIALKDAGVSAIIAKSFARIFRRNAINIGLPVLYGDVVEEIETGDEVQLKIYQYKLENITKDKTFQLEELSQVTMETLEAGGLINKVKMILNIRGDMNE
ncbi:3-isopropylmalate dehydratase [Natranaerobius thermophilus]|uniref:3-isopropylmalate dehydratase small subunit n=1 Tax=Natranaerobius thermophilus (strain ATCC BAA-1301 / DSM 18059 / JW/NM-WN-LF) TaxID=457570 RepID=B2A7L5_NATTJ|nr:3-isopropylmalate dehydratase [Natranaerobius thermophilus]ACB85724.1 3-isopropylmalate dehydratase, small subunit [Natranaerobius thermophilus JW/NM-WN-LF]